jgi:O-antigen ligase
MYIGKSLNALFGKWLQYLGIYIIVQDSIIYNRKVVKRGISVFLVGAFFVVFSGLSQYFFGIEFLRGRLIASLNSGNQAITASFNHYNAFGGYLVVVLSLVIALLLNENRFRPRTAILSALSIFSTLAIFLTFSRGSWLAIALAFIFICFFSKKHIKWLLPIFLIIIVMLLLPVFQERLFLTFKPGGDSDRFRYWLAAIKMIKDHPFLGMGVGTFMANFSNYLPGCSVSYAHNCYLQIWAETGVFSLISFMLFVCSLIYFGVRKFIVSKDFLLLGLLSGVLGFLAHSFFDTNFYSLRLAVLFWIWAGLIAGRIGEAS